VNSIIECVLNVLNGNIQLKGCSKRKLRKHKAALRKVADKRVPLSNKKKFIVQRRGILLHLLSADLPTIASLIFKPSYKDKREKKICYLKCISFRPTALNNPPFLLFQRRNQKSPSRRRRRDKNKSNVNTLTKSGLSTVKRSARQISNARLRYRRLRFLAG